MRIPGLKTAKLAAKWLHNRVFPGAVILGYHRVANVEADSFYNCVSPENFDRQMEVLREYTNPVHVNELIAQLGEGNPPPGTVCVTIDDGYADALDNAKPILEKHDIPATVFVTTGYLGGEFWWDEVERYILNLPQHAGKFQLMLGKQVAEWDFSNTDLAARMEKVVAIADLLRPLDNENRRRLLDELREWAGSLSPLGKPRARGMTPEELVTLNDSQLVDIGSHSVTHPMLPDLDFSERQHELKTSKYALEQIISQPVTGFSYPNGRFKTSDLELVQQSGYQYACASVNGTVRQSSRRFSLPRFWVHDVDGDKFHRWLRLWLS